MQRSLASCNSLPPLDEQYLVNTIGRILSSNRTVAAIKTQQSVSVPTINIF